MSCAPVCAIDGMLGSAGASSADQAELRNPFAGRSTAVAVSAGAAVIAWAIAMRRVLCGTSFAWVVSPLFTSSASSFPIPLVVGAWVYGNSSAMIVLQRAHAIQY